MADWRARHPSRGRERARTLTVRNLVGCMSETATATVSALYYYPVKSIRGVATERARLEATGFAWDRQWMIVDAAAQFLTQRTHPHMARIVPQVNAAIPDASAPRRRSLAFC